MRRARISSRPCAVSKRQCVPCLTIGIGNGQSALPTLSGGPSECCHHHDRRDQDSRAHRRPPPRPPPPPPPPRLPPPPPPPPPARPPPPPPPPDFWKLWRLAFPRSLKLCVERPLPTPSNA